MAVTEDFKGIMQNLLEQFKPGGAIEQQRFAEAEREGQRLRAQLAGSAIQRGLGNAAIGIPTQVHESVQRAKKGISSELSGQYLGVLTNLLSLSMQEEQAELDRQFQREQTATQASSNRATMRYNDKQAQKQREHEEWLNAIAADQARIQAIEDRRSGKSQQPGAGQLPSLYQAGGYGQDSMYAGELLFSDDDLGLFNLQPTRQESNTVPTSYGYGPMFGD